MDQSTLVEDQIYDGRRFVERFAADGKPVNAAFWVRTAEEGLWFLYVVSEIYHRDGPAAAYRAVDAAFRRLEGPSISTSDIKVIGPENPIAKDVMAFLASHPDRLAMRLGGRTLGSMAVEQTYIYPPHVYTITQPDPMTTEEIGREILRLMNRSPGILEPSRVSLRDGTEFNGVPFAIEGGARGTMMARFIADREAAPRVYRLDEIASIR